MSLTTHTVEVILKNKYDDNFLKFRKDTGCDVIIDLSQMDPIYKDFGCMNFSHTDYMYYMEPDERDVCFIMGAGASYANGLLLQNEIIPHFFNSDDKYLTNSSVYITIKKFLEKYFTPNFKNNIYPTLEQIYAFIEYHIQNHKSLNSEYNYDMMIKIKKMLNLLLYYIIITSRNETGNNSYFNFWEKVVNINRNISIITMNYDTDLEDNFDHFFFNKALIDYKVDFINYRKCNPSEWWDDASKPISLPLMRSGSYEPVPIKILKIHGSLNWKYCDCCDNVLLAFFNRNIDLDKMAFLEDESAEVNPYKLSSTKCPIDGNELSQLIIPPSHFKDFYRISIDELNKAKKICFIGYSFPDADFHIKALLNKINMDDKEVYCVNPSISDNTTEAYLNICRNIKFRYVGFEEYINSKDFIDLLS